MSGGAEPGPDMGAGLEKLDRIEWQLTRVPQFDGKTG